MRHQVLSVVRIVAVKEMKDFFRDPRSLALSLVLPLVLFPLLFWVLSDHQTQKSENDRVYQIGFDPALTSLPDISGSESVILSGFEESYPFEWRNRYDAVLIQENPEEPVVIVYDNSNPLSISAFRYMESLLADNPEVPGSGISDITPLTGPGCPLFMPEEAEGKIFLGLILPFIFFIFATTCPLPGAADISSGEKERGSLEPLLSTAASRTGLILGKLMSASVIGLCSVCAYCLGVFVSCLVAPEILGPVPLVFPLSPGQILMLALLLFLLTSLFTAIEICAGFITKSVREAQLLAMPLLVLGMGAVYTAQSLEIAHKSWIYAHLPLVNLALAVRETALDRIIAADAAAAVLWCLVYLGLMILLAVRMFQKEFSPVKNRKWKKILVRN